MEAPRLLVLRVWTAPSAFRAVVRDLSPERIAYFDDPGALCRYLLEPDAPAADDAGADQPSVGPAPAHAAARPTAPRR